MEKRDETPIGSESRAYSKGPVTVISETSRRLGECGFSVLVTTTAIRRVRTPNGDLPHNRVWEMNYHYNAAKKSFVTVDAMPTQTSSATAPSAEPTTSEVSSRESLLRAAFDYYCRHFPEPVFQLLRTDAGCVEQLHSNFLVRRVPAMWTGWSTCTAASIHGGFACDREICTHGAIPAKCPARWSISALAVERF